MELPTSVGQTKLTYIPQNPQGERIGEVAPKTDNGTDPDGRYSPVENPEAVVTCGPGSGDVDFPCPGKMFREAVLYVVVCDQHDTGSSCAVGIVLPQGLNHSETSASSERQKNVAEYQGGVVPSLSSMMRPTLAAWAESAGAVRQIAEYGGSRHLSLPRVEWTGRPRR